MNIARGEKFACFAFTHCARANELPAEIELWPRLWAASSLDVSLAEHWQQWLGSLTTDELPGQESLAKTRP